MGQRRSAGHRLRSGPGTGRRARLLVANLFIAGVAMPSISAGEARGPVDFAAEIRPLLEQHCIRCHSPNNRQGDFSFASRDDLFDNGYVVPGDPAGSHVVDIVTGSDGRPPRMPKEGRPLSAEQVETLRRWIAEGAVWPAGVAVVERSKADRSWWSLRPLADAPPPTLAAAPPGWADHPIDRFLAAALAEKGLRPNPPADRRTLIRRATYDLTGLPPTPEEVEAFAADGDPQAYDKLLDRLLASPRYGERWGRHWLDVVRFGESNGFERNRLIDELWPFRDWVIASFNADGPFDRFIRDHLAGDVIGPDDPQIMIGSAFLVAGPFDDVGNQDAGQQAQIRADTLDEIIRATGEAFLGLTVGCARCHNHKFDPITQADYYRLHAAFTGVRHDAVDWATPAEKAERRRKLEPLEARRQELRAARVALDDAIRARRGPRLEELRRTWTRPPVDRRGTEESFPPVMAKFVRLVCEAGDVDPDGRRFHLDELEIFTSGSGSRNVALAAAGGIATSGSRGSGHYGPNLVIDGRFGERFHGSDQVTIELAEPVLVDRVVFSSGREEATPDQPEFRFVAEYRIEVSRDGTTWTEVASGRDRRPIERPLPGAKPTADRPQPLSPLDHRLSQAAATEEEAARRTAIATELAEVEAAIKAVPRLPQAWIGRRVAADAAGPFHVFLGGSPQKRGDEVVPASPGFLADVVQGYTLPADGPEAARRLALADWLVAADNPLTPRVLANRLWHHHFGTGIVATPNDFGFMGSPPSHPRLLDWLARRLVASGWRLKPMHRLIMTSQAYRQGSGWRGEAAAVDAGSRLLWRFPPRRLAAEEIRDTILAVSGRLDTRMGGPGFRLYEVVQDNVSTYTPLENHPPATYRRAVYHQNARASVVDLMTEFDQADCTLSAPRRDSTTTPLQALTLLNHGFTLDMAAALAARVEREAAAAAAPPPVDVLFRLVYQRLPAEEERSRLAPFLAAHGLPALCRVLLNSNELLYLD